jgi:hypothetical protein
VYTHAHAETLMHFIHRHSYAMYVMRNILEVSMKDIFNIK